METVEQLTEDLAAKKAECDELRAALRAIAASAVLATGELPVAALEDAPGLLAQLRVLVDRVQN